MSDWTHAAFPRTCTYLEMVGVDPTSVAVEGFTATSYKQYIRDDFGNRVYYNGLAQMVTVGWPDGAIGGTAMEFYEIDLEDQA